MRLMASCSFFFRLALPLHGIDDDGDEKAKNGKGGNQNINNEKRFSEAVVSGNLAPCRPILPAS